MKKKTFLFSLIALALTALSVNAMASDGKISVAKAFYELARQNNVKKIESLQLRGYSIDSPDERGYTPVCLSVINQDKRAYKTLVSYGANKQPSCLKQIPESAYKRFFGNYPVKEAAKTYVPDAPYTIAAAVLGAGAITAAIALKGDTNGGEKDETGGGESGGEGGDDKPTPPDPEKPEDCPENSHFVPHKGICECNPGYGHYGHPSKCFGKIPNCKNQEKDTCKQCIPTYILDAGICYAPIKNCQKQVGGKCEQCVAGFGTHNGNGSVCYANIERCQIQKEDKCEQCIPGYGTHGDPHSCHKNIDNCLNQLQTICKQCQPGYDTYGDPYKCYDRNPCAAYPNSVPTDQGRKCLCDVNRGYTGDPYKGGCSQTDGGEYQEGDDVQEEWNNYNELYCNSHGKYDIGSRLCLCYTGYEGDDCSKCSPNYLKFGNVCTRDLECKEEENRVQDMDACICMPGFSEFEIINGEVTTLQCLKNIQCEPHYEQVSATQCACKKGFDEKCEKCREDEGYEYDEIHDECIRIRFVCEGNWTGENCDVCPPQFVLSEDGLTCGVECAPNRAPIASNPKCEDCAENYYWSAKHNNCITDECASGQPGYVYVTSPETGEQTCECDIAHGYGRNKLGKCEAKKEDLIGEKDNNINNKNITLINYDEMRDVYGMKPTMGVDEEGNTIYYDSVYNAKSSSGNETGNIEISNKKVGNNLVYGIYSKSNIYNAAVMNSSGGNATANGNIHIEDDMSSSDIYGIYTEGEKHNIYNGFAFSGSQTPSKNIANGDIYISKTSSSNGNIFGMKGNDNIYNAYANSNGGTQANAVANGKLTIEHKGTGSVFGIINDNANATIHNSLAFLDSAVSDSVATGEIKLSGNGGVYGIYAEGSVINSETQFKKNYNIVNNFSSKGIIDITSSSDVATSYGIYSSGKPDTKTSLYNAKGYNTNGLIRVTNIGGGSIYGMYSGAQTYQDEVEEAAIYNNTYNAFRSSAVYGETTAKGEIEAIISGYSSLNQNVVGIFAAGNVYNSYANSGSDVKLSTEGRILVKDESTTSSLKINGIESAGATIANAYGMGQNQNTATVTKGTIDIEINKSKNSDSFVSGIRTTVSNPQGAKIYNAALVNDKNTVIGKINLNATDTARAPSFMYGIYSTSEINNGEGGQPQPKYIYNAYYENDTKESAGKVLGEINVTAKNESLQAEAEYYGIYVNNGEAYNAYSSNLNADVVGRINVTVAGGSMDGKAVGMYGETAKLNNSGKSEINVHTTGHAKAIGMEGRNAHIYNNAKITVTSDKDEAIGMKINGGTAVNDVDGVIKVSGNQKNYGIFAISDGTTAGATKVINKGTINLEGTGENTGIYGSGKTTVIQNNGRITINGKGCVGGTCNEGSYIVLHDGATFNNSGDLSTTGALDFNKMGGNVILDKNGSFTATEDIKGDLKVSSNVVKDTFAKESVIENALSSKDITDVNLISNSYLYDSKTKMNENGKYDVVMEMKDFATVTDADKAGYLQANYEQGRGQELFNKLKAASTGSSFKQAEAELMGISVLPNISQENLKIQRSIDRSIVANLFKPAEDERKIVGGDGMYIGRDTHGTLEGYDLQSQTMYTLYDKKLNNHYRAGVGLSITNTDTDYNDDSQRSSFMVQGYIPVSYQNDKGLTAITMARLGYSDGDYKRYSVGSTYKADTKDITFGLINELRYEMILGGLRLTPFVGLNIMGWYQDDIREHGGTEALKIASDSNLSIESALGLYLDKEVELAENHKLGLSIGAGYYHEFADPYEGFDATHIGNVRKYKLENKGNMNSYDRGMLTAKVNYEYKDFSIYGELMQYLEEEYPINVDLGMKYKF